MEDIEISKNEIRAVMFIILYIIKSLNCRIYWRTTFCVDLNASEMLAYPFDEIVSVKHFNDYSNLPRI